MKWSSKRRSVVLLLAGMSLFVLISLCGTGMGNKMVWSSTSSAFTFVREMEGHEVDHHYDAKGRPLRDFGPRNQYRAAHIATRAVVVNNNTQKFLPFNATLVHPMFRALERIEVEVEYFRFRDPYGLIDAELNDSDILFLLQTVVDTYALANVYLRIRPTEALAFVDLSEQRAKAYWYYVDYPRGNNKPLSSQAKERKRVMDQVIGRDMIRMLDSVDKRDYNGVLDWVLGMPFERTRWEQRNVVAIFPTYFFAHMNGAGQTNCLRFRTGDCTAPKTLKNLPVDYEVKTKCLHFRGNATSEEDHDEMVVVREWEREPMTRHRLVRLISHEMGHALKLQHIVSGKKCVELKGWQEGNVMNQIRQMHLEGTKCKSEGYPIEAVKAMQLWPKQAERVREGLRADLRQTPVAPNMHRMGKSLETVAKFPASDRSQIFGFVAQQISLTSPGRVRRVSWKSGNLLQQGIKISVGRFDNNNNSHTWIESASQSVQPHMRGAHLHQEHEVDLPIALGESVALIGLEDLAPDSHLYDNAGDLLIKDLTSCIPKREVIHLHMNNYFNRVDKDKVKVKRADMKPGVMVMTANGKWEPMSTTEWLVNFDLLL